MRKHNSKLYGPYKLVRFDDACLIIRNGAGQGLVYIYFDDGDAVRREAAGQMTKAEATELGKMIARMLTERGKKELHAKPRSQK